MVRLRLDHALCTHCCLCYFTTTTTWYACLVAGRHPPPRTVAFWAPSHSPPPLRDVVCRYGVVLMGLTYMVLRGLISFNNVALCCIFEGGPARWRSGLCAVCCGWRDMCSAVLWLVGMSVVLTAFLPEQTCREIMARLWVAQVASCSSA